jgi:hypothetical protein
MLFVHILLGGAFPKRLHANCGVIAVIRKVPILGRHIGELVHRYQEMRQAPGRYLEWSHHVKAPNSKQPRDRDGLESHRWGVPVLGQALAPVAMLH